MLYLNSFLFCGFVCLIGQIILDNTKLTPGHITSIFVVVGAFLDIFSIYDKIILWAGGGALVPITSFGHLLIHGALEKAQEFGFMGLAMGMFDLTASGIISAIIISFFFDAFAKLRPKRLCFLLKTGVSGELRYLGSPLSIILPPKPIILPCKSIIGNISLS